MISSAYFMSKSVFDQQGCRSLTFALARLSCSTYRPSSFKHLSHLSTSFWMPDAKNDAGCCSSHCRTTDCTSISDANLCPPPLLAFSSSAQKDDNHWGPSPGCTAGVVTPLTPGVPQSPESDVQCAVERYRATESLLVSAVLYVLFISQFWVTPADCCMCYNI